MKGDTFYDIHMHAFNLSHPYFSAFIKRFKIEWLFVAVAIVSFIAVIPPLRRSIVDRMLRRIRNLLSVIENDIGSFFLLTENCVREAENPLLIDDELYIGEKAYSKIVLTPLMMDFGLKGIEEDAKIHYGKPSEKPVVEQVIDVFNAIRKYRKANSSPKLCKKYPSIKPGTSRIFEIYPFLGLNTKNYDKPHIEGMLKKYFGEYKGLREEFLKNLGQFNGNIESLQGYFFAGIKVYPPLGFDPWPTAVKEHEKVESLYSYCCEKDLPITAHGSKGGFVVVKKGELKKLTSISKWEQVLSKYPDLKLNLAHFPMQEKILWIIPDPRHRRLKAMLRLVLENKNVYVDFSNRATSDHYYKSLKNLLDGLITTQKTKLTDHILFGSDYTVNLMAKGIKSYNKYLDNFSKTEYLTPEEKHSFCCTNPERFLFS